MLLFNINVDFIYAEPAGTIFMARIVRLPARTMQCNYAVEYMKFSSAQDLDAFSLSKNVTQLPGAGHCI